MTTNPRLELRPEEGDVIQLFEDVWAHRDDMFCVRGIDALVFEREAKIASIVLPRNLLTPIQGATGVCLYLEAPVVAALFEASSHLRESRSCCAIRNRIRAAAEGSPLHDQATVSLLQSPNDFPTMPRIEAAFPISVGYEPEAEAEE